MLRFIECQPWDWNSWLFLVQGYLSSRCASDILQASVNRLLLVTSPTANLTVFSWVPLLSRRSPANVGRSLKSSRKQPQVLKVFRPVRVQGCRLNFFSVVNQRKILNRKISSHVSKKEGNCLGRRYFY